MPFWRSSGSTAERIIAATAVVVVFAYAYIFYIAPLNGEDFALTRDFQDIGWPERLHWIAQRSSEQIAGWNARLGEQLAIFWLGMPHLGFVIAQTVAFVGLCYLSATLWDETNAWRRTLIALTLVFAVWPAMETFFWRTAAAEYLQPLLLCLFVLRWYVSAPRLKALATGGSTCVFVTVAAFLAGLSFENVPAAMVVFMVASVAMAHRPLASCRTVLPILAMACGWACLILAPSTAIRRAFYASVHHVDGYSAAYLATRTADVMHGFFSWSWPLAVLAVAALSFAWRDVRDRRRLALLVGLVVVLVGSVVPAPYTESRAFILTWALMLGICVLAVDQVVTRFRYGAAAVACLAVVFLAFPAFAAVHYSRFAHEAQALDQRIRDARRTPACDSGIEVSPATKRYPRRYINDRIAWYRDNAAFVGTYYGCRVVIDPVH